MSEIDTAFMAPRRGELEVMPTLNHAPVPSRHDCRHAVLTPRLVATMPVAVGDPRKTAGENSQDARPRSRMP
ncbi:hypothetical protein GCM10020220_062960 [Nonomuraea rubra]